MVEYQWKNEVQNDPACDLHYTAIRIEKIWWKQPECEQWLIWIKNFLALNFQKFYHNCELLLYFKKFISLKKIKTNLC